MPAASQENEKSGEEPLVLRGKIIWVDGLWAGLRKRTNPLGRDYEE